MFTGYNRVNEKSLPFFQMLKCRFEPESVSNVESIESAASNIGNKSQVYNFVEDLCIVHSDLCDACDIASDFFSLKLLCIIGTAFLCLLVNGYFSILTFLHDDNGLDRREILEIVYGIVENVMIGTGITIASNCSHKIGDQVRIIKCNF